MHNLSITSPHTHGADVEALQNALNELAHRHGTAKIGADGDFGHETLQAARREGYLLGAPMHYLHGAVQPHLQLIIEHPDHRSPAELYRSKVRLKARSEMAHSPAGALRWAHGQLGITEHPAGSNAGGPLHKRQDGIYEGGPSAYQHNFGIDGSPWCGAFAGTALLIAGVHVTPRIVYVPYIVDDARRGANGLARLVSWENRQGGDLITLFGEEHVEILDEDRRHSYGGNTSPGDEGSQSNGGCVAHKLRDPGQVDHVIRPRWS